MSATQESNKDIVRQYLAAFNDRDKEGLSGLLADDVVEHGIHEKLDGDEESLEFLDRHFDIFPDYSGTTETVVAEGDTVTVQYTVSGTHSGEYMDVQPTGNAAEWTGMAMYRIEDDEITEVRTEADRPGLLEQLEAVDPSAHLGI